MVYHNSWPHLDIPQCNLLSYLFPQGCPPSTRPLWFDAGDPTRSLSPAQLLSLVKRFAVGLDTLGVPFDRPILVISPNHIYFPVGFLGVVGSKRIFTAVNPAYTVDEVVYQIKSSEAEMILVHPDLLVTGLAAVDKTKFPRDRLYLFSDMQQPTTHGIRDWRRVLAAEDDAEAWQWDPLPGDAAAQTTATINFSSGTTGLSKGVCITHHNIVANMVQSVVSNFYGRDFTTASSCTSWLGFLPMYHAYSQLYNINVACKLGVTVYVMPRFDFELFLAYIEKYRITDLCVVPPIIVMMVKRPEADRYDLSSVKRITSGAAPLSADMQMQIWDKFRVNVSQGWGMSEATCSAVTCPGLVGDGTGSVGRLLANTEARLVDDEGRDIEADTGQPGEIWVRGPQVMKGYWRNEAATRETLTTEGWLKTGDVAVTKNGLWWIVDRKKELIKVNGLQVAPAELEAVLLRHPSVADAAVTSIITADGRESPRAYVVLKSPENDSTQGSVDEIQTWVAGTVAKHKRLTGGVSLVKEVPKLPSGKIVRKVVRQWAKEDEKRLRRAGKEKL